jgi:hypothetical protein
MIKIYEQGRHKYFNMITVKRVMFCIFSLPSTRHAKPSSILTSHQETYQILTRSVPFISASLHCSRPSSLHQQLRRVWYLPFSYRPERVRPSFWTTAGSNMSVPNPKDSDSGKGSYLGNGLLLRTDKTEKGANHTKESKHSTGKSSTSLRVSL